MKHTFKLKHVLVCLGILLGVIVVMMIPFRLLFNNFMSELAARSCKRIIVSVIVIISAIGLAHRWDIMKEGGFRNGRAKNYWFLILPVIFPGSIFLQDFKEECIRVTGLFLLAFSGRMIWGLMEEVVFRGLIQGYLVKKYPQVTYHRICLFTAFLFALMHLVNLSTDHFLSVLPQLVFAFFTGLLMSALMIRTNNVWLVGIVHGTINFMAMPCQQLVDNTVEIEVEHGLLFEYLKQFGQAVLIFSPALLLYWLLMRTGPKSPSAATGIK